jgi:4-oxalocrotonate tautomerase
VPELRRGPPRALDDRRAIGDVVHQAMVETMGAAADARFQVIHEHPAVDIIADRGHLGIARTDDCVFVQVTLTRGRSVPQKKAFFAAVADGLHERLKLRREDVVISLIEVAKETWSFGCGVKGAPMICTRPGPVRAMSAQACDEVDADSKPGVVSGRLADFMHKCTSDRTKLHGPVAAERGCDEII